MPEPKNIYTKLAVVLASIGYMQKDKRNVGQNYSYLSEAKIKDRVRELFVEQALVFQYSTTGSREYEIGQTKNGQKMFVTEAWGSWGIVDSETGAVVNGEWRGTGSDTGDKGLYKAITGGIKYVFNTMFLIQTGDDPETDTENHTETTKEQKPATQKPTAKGEDDGLI
ncbi:MAG: ERF family protein [Saccharofermentanaceae bacterium]|jgi:hypothetical protein